MELPVQHLIAASILLAIGVIHVAIYALSRWVVFPSFPERDYGGMNIYRSMFWFFIVLFLLFSVEFLSLAFCEITDNTNEFVIMLTSPLLIVVSISLGYCDMICSYGERRVTTNRPVTRNVSK